MAVLILAKIRAVDVLLLDLFLVFFLPLTVLGLCCCMASSLVAECWGCSLLAVRGLLTVMASLAAQPGSRA